MELMAHQARAVERAKTTPRFAFFHDTGTGKTCIGIHIIKTFNVKTLVVCPLSLIEVAWRDDFAKFAPELKPVNLWAALQKRKRKGGEALVRQALDAQIGIINYEMFRLVMPEIIKSGYKMLIIDESSKCKQIKSSITKKIIAYSEFVDRVYLFSGTPAPNSELEYWPQIRVLSKQIFGSSFYAWRNRYCYATGYGGYEWKLKKEEKENFLNKLGAVSEVVRKEDVLDLPERTENKREVTLSANERAAYDKMAKDLVYELEGVESVAANVAVKIMKLREATSGFLIGEGGQVIPTGTSKLDALLELLGEIGGHQVVIWTQFQYEAAKIRDALGRKAHLIDGTVSSQEVRIERVRDFVAGRTQYMVAHPASLGHGVTLVNATYAVYFSLSYSYELHTQSMDRIYRNGQRNACTYYYLCAKDTVDGVILQALRNKGKAAESVFAYLKRKEWLL